MTVPKSELPITIVVRAGEARSDCHPEGPQHGPGARQCMVDRGDLDVQKILVALIAIEPLLDDGLCIRVQGNAATVKCARPLEAAALDLEDAEPPVTVAVEPLADRVPVE